jgi:tetratricopeptide (TPR) repeat protein
MGFFKKLFGQKQETATASDTGMAQRFDKDWFAAVERYKIVTGIGSELNFVLTHPQTMEIVAPHTGLNQTFREWQELPTLYARRQLLFRTILEIGGGGMSKVWHAANFCVADSRGDEALAALEAEDPPHEGDEDYASHCDAYARAYIVLIREAEAVPWARKAVAAAPENTRFQTVLADALYLSGEHEEAYGIYDRLMATASLGKASKEEAIRELFTNEFALETGVLPSPVMASQMAAGLADPQQSAEFWALTEDEFYYSPQFRMQHAYHLLEQGEQDRFVAKMAGLIDDMYWVKEANLNLIGFLEQVDPAGKNVLPEMQAEIRERIRENNWTAEGMGEYKIDL